VIKIWVKKKFITIFNDFHKIANLLQREWKKSVEPSICGGEKTCNVKKLPNTYVENAEESR